jgi:hypothetical protein
MTEHEPERGPGPYLTVVLARIRAAIAAQDWEQSGWLSLRAMAAGEFPSPLPADVADVLAELRGLDLSGNRLTAVPAWLGQLDSLEQLDLSGNRITALDGLRWLSRLSALELSDNRLRTLPDGWAAGGRLRWLSLAGNRLTSLVPLAPLPAVQVLDVARNRLETLEGLPGAATLRSLDASGNELARLAPGLDRFRALRRLDLSRNRLTADAIEPLADLPVSELLLGWNQIAEARPWFAQRDFRVLSVTGNPIRDETFVADAVVRDLRTTQFVTDNTTGGYEPGVQYFEAPESQFAFRIEARDQPTVRELVDLYYSSYADLPARLSAGDQLDVPLSAITRRRALELLEGQAQAELRMWPTSQQRARDEAAAFAVDTVTRLPGAALIADETGERLAGAARPAEPRVVNLTVADAAGAVLPETAALAAGTTHLLQVGLGPEAGMSVVLNPAALPLAELTPSAGGWWFDIVAASADVEIAAEAHRMFVPFHGAGWTCPCTGEEHTCLPRDRRELLEIAFRTRDAAGPATLRCTAYHNNNAVQSIRVTFAVGPRTPATLIQGVVDYSLADDLALAGALAPRQLSVVTNTTPAVAGTHTIVVKGAGAPPVAVNLTEAGAGNTLRAVRDELTLITLGRGGQDTRYGPDNEAPVSQLTADLETLAVLGSRFWQDAVPFGADQDVLRPLLRSSSTIQIARVTDTVFPWSVVYDYPHLLGDPWVPCELLRQWPTARATLTGYPDGCPFAGGHKLNTLCPFGFWGFRHLLEQPPSVARGLLRTSIPVPDGAHAATVRSLNLDAALTTAHLKQLGRCLGPRFAVTDCDSRDGFVAAIGTALPLIYFYCHGRTAKLGDAGVDLETPYLEIGHDEMLGTGDLNAWAATGAWQRKRWQEVPPLIFINGCHTAALSPEQLVTFVNAFAGAEAAGVIGTEIAVAQPVASEFAQRFYQHLLGGPGAVAPSGAPAGQALRRARLDLLAKGNVAGLVYTAFCSMDLTLGTGGGTA